MPTIGKIQPLLAKKEESEVYSARMAATLDRTGKCFSFLDGPALSFFRICRWERDFKARSADRDAETDRARVGSILEAIENVLHAAEQEQSGLSRRVEDVLARAAVTFGNGTDEYRSARRSTATIMTCSTRRFPTASGGWRNLAAIAAFAALATG